MSSTQGSRRAAEQEAAEFAQLLANEEMEVIAEAIAEAEEAIAEAEEPKLLHGRSTELRIVEAEDPGTGPPKEPAGSDVSSLLQNVVSGPHSGLRPSALTADEVPMSSPQSPFQPRQREEEEE